MRMVDDYIDALEEDRKLICEKIRELLFSLVPGIEERFSFKLPFYHYFGMFLYLSNTKEGITVSFCRGRDLTGMFPQLQSGNRAIVASVVISSPNQIHALQLPEMISTAAAWNQEAKKLKLPMVRSAKRSGPAKDPLSASEISPKRRSSAARSNKRTGRQ